MPTRVPVENRRVAMMELLIAHPEKTGKEIGTMVGLSASRTATIMQDPIFQLAFEEYRRQHMEKVSDLKAALDTQIKEATQVAIDESVKIMRTDTPAVVKQKSITDILNQGHAKAIEKRVDAHIDVPGDVIRELLNVAKGMQTPLIPVRKLERLSEEDSEVIEIPAN